MTFSILTPDTAASTIDDILLRRALLAGSPGAGKTVSLATFAQPMAYVCYPGEKGASSLPKRSTITRFLPEPIDPEKPQNWAQIIAGIERTTNEILARKHGTFRTFAGDGLHKLHALYLAEQTAGASMRGEDFEARLYGPAHKKFFTYLDRVMRSRMEYVVFTVWDGRERDDPQDKRKDAPSHIFPQLPGAAAKDIMGEFAVALYATKMGTRYVWQTKPQGSVWGCGIKLPPDITEKIPAFVDQDWAKLEPLLTPKATKEVAA